MSRFIVSLVLVVSAAAWISSRTPNGSVQETLYSQLRDMPEIIDLIDRAYVDDTDVAQLMDGAFQGALEAIDPGAGFVLEADQAMLDPWPVAKRTGLVVSKSKSNLIAMVVFPNSVAAEIGISQGEHIIEINGQQTRRISLHQAQKSLMASKIALTIENDKAETRKLILEAEERVLPSPSLELVQHGAILRLPVFPSDLDKFLTKYDASLTDLEFLVLDLRHNALPNDDAIASLGSRLFLKGTFAELRSSVGLEKQLNNSTSGRWTGSRVVILVDESTSASAEALCALVVSLDCGTLVGKKTKGLPYHYESITLKGGGSIILSTRKITDPSGADYVGKGVNPDHPLKTVAATALESAVKIARHQEL